MTFGNCRENTTATYVHRTLHTLWWGLVTEILNIYKFVLFGPHISMQTDIADEDGCCHC